MSIEKYYLIPHFFVSEVATGAGLCLEKFANVSLYGSAVKNLIAVTLGSIVSGGLFVATLYWFAYIRKSQKADDQ